MPIKDVNPEGEIRFLECLPKVCEPLPVNSLLAYDGQIESMNRPRGSGKPRTERSHFTFGHESAQGRLYDV